MVEKLLVLFSSHCNISAYTQLFELKFSMLTKFDTWISDLNSYVQYRIVKKISKIINFVSSNSQIYRITNYFLLGKHINYRILCPILCQKSKIFERKLKNGTVFVKKASFMFMTSLEQEKHLLIQIQLFQSKSSISAKCFCQVNRV